MNTRAADFVTVSIFALIGSFSRTILGASFFSTITLGAT